MQAADRRSAACCELVSDVARASGEVRLKLTGTSMVPAVWPGDVVTVRRCAFADLQRGQIVLCRAGGSLTAHRIHSLFTAHLISRGDALLRCDPPVGELGVVGQVIGIVRDGRPVSLEPSVPHRVVSSLVRRSELCRSITLRLGGNWWG